MLLYMEVEREILEAKLLKRIKKFLLSSYFPTVKYSSNNDFSFYTCPRSLRARSAHPVEKHTCMAVWTQAICPDNLLQSVDSSRTFLKW